MRKFSLTETETSRRDLLKLGAGGLGVGLASMVLPGLPGTALAASASDAALMKAAKAEGGLNTIALPPDWANYGEIISTFEKKYGIKITNASPDASSAQELQAIKSLKGQKRGPDVVDVGPSFAVAGTSQHLFRPYKVSTWSSIPSNMKDAGGLWYGDYFGVITFGVNRSAVKNPPKSWADLKKPEYKGMIALNGSPTGAAAAFSGVFASSLANGGSLNNIEPGLKFFGELAKIGNFTPVVATAASLASGQTPIVINWDYLNLAQADKAKGQTQIDVIVPDDAHAFGGYYCQAISHFAPNPKAAELWMEFIYSDEGQLLFLKGFAHPARFADMVSRNVVPEEMLKALPPAAPYKTVQFPTLAQAKKAQTLVTQQWSQLVKS